MRFRLPNSDEIIDLSTTNEFHDYREDTHLKNSFTKLLGITDLYKVFVPGYRARPTATKIPLNHFSALLFYNDGKVLRMQTSEWGSVERAEFILLGKPSVTFSSKPLQIKSPEQALEVLSNHKHTLIESEHPEQYFTGEKVFLQGQFSPEELDALAYLKRRHGPKPQPNTEPPTPEDNPVFSEAIAQALLRKSDAWFDTDVMRDQPEFARNDLGQTTIGVDGVFTREELQALVHLMNIEEAQSENQLASAEQGDQPQHLANIPPKSQKLPDLIERALMEPTLEEALSWIVIWDTDRAVRQAVANPDKSYETCSLFLIHEVSKAWHARPAATDL